MGKQTAAKRKAPRRAPRRRAPSARAGRRRWLPWAGLGAAGLVLASWFVSIRAVPSRSMEDTLLPGDWLLVVRTGDVVPRPGELVVFASPENPEQTLVKRCIAVAGQRVEVRDKAVFVDGQRFPDPPFSKYLDARLLPAERGPRDNLAPRTVPEGHLFVLGDNRDNSRDSRHWGFLPVSAVVGRPLFVCFSAAPADPAAGFGQRLSSLAGRVRWARIGTGLP